MNVNRILHVIGGLNRGGAETFAMNLYRAIDKSVIQFDFVVHSAEENAYFEEVKYLGGKVYVFPKFRLKNIVSYIRTWHKFLDAHSEYKIIHSHVRSYACFFLNAAKHHGITTIVHSHSTSNGFGVKAFIKNVFQLPLRFQADYLFACSRQSGEWLFGKKACKKDNFFIVKNAIDVSRYSVSEQVKKQYRKELNISDKHVFGHLGRLTEPKNHLFLLDIFNYIKIKDDNAVLLLIGDGEKRAETESKINELHLGNSVIMTGSRPDIPELLSVTDVFIFPSLWEGFPISVIEAQASGLPCILSDVITDEVAMSPAVHFLSLSDSAETWAEKAISLLGKKYSADNLIRTAGFDINQEALKLTEFYLRTINLQRKDYACKK